MRSRTTQAAAAALRVSQPAVSNAIRQMETQIGFDLFDRVGKRLVPTPDAEEIFRDSEAIFELYNVFAQRLESRKTNTMGTLQIVCTSSVANALMPPVIRDFIATRPDVRINLDSRRLDDLYDSLESRRADIGFALNPRPRPGLECEELALAQMVCAFPPGHPLSEKLAIAASDLADYPLVLFEPGSKMNLILEDNYLNDHLRTHARARVRDKALACRLAEAGVGPTLVDSLTAYAGHRYDLDYRPLYPTQPVTVCAIYRNTEPPKRVQTAFLDAVRNSDALAGVVEFGRTEDD